MSPTSPVATDVMSLFDDIEEVAHRVRTRVDRELEMVESAEGVGEESPGRQLSRAAQVARAQALFDGARGLERLARDPGADLTGSEQFGVEAIVLLVARPALLVQSGDSTTSARRSATRSPGWAGSRPPATPTSTGWAPVSSSLPTW